MIDRPYRDAEEAIAEAATETMEEIVNDNEQLKVALAEANAKLEGRKT